MHILLICFQLAFLQLLAYAKYRKLTTVELIEMHGYECETHYITTEDGYILGYQRIPHGINETKTNTPAVLMMHGLLSASAEFVSLGPKRGLGFILADSGYDVWLANSRGTTWSRNHTTIKPFENPKMFFDFSWHEMGLYDIPAAIDYILNVNGEDSLHYIGNSQGAVAYLVLGSLKPEYNKKIKLGTLLAPGISLDHYGAFQKAMYRGTLKIFKNWKAQNIYEFPWIENFQNLIMRICSESKEFVVIFRIVAVVLGNDPQLENTIFPVLGMFFPNHASLKQLEHYIQIVLTGDFRHFDYKENKNKKVYGTVKPPEYNLSKVTAPTAIYIGRNDYTAGYPSIQKLVKRLPAVVHYYEPSHDSFNHIDFTVARDVVKLAFNEIIRCMKLYD